MNLKACRVLVTATSYGKSDSSLKTDLETAVGEVLYNSTGKPLNSTDLARLLPGIDGMIAGLDVIDRAALEAADCLKVIARYGVGVDNVDLQAAREKGILVTNTPGANSVSVAELTIGLILSLARHIPEAAAAICKGGWPRLAGITLEGKTIAILGLGSVGKEVARRLAAFHCRLVSYDPLADPDFAARYAVALVPLQQAIGQADFLTLHLPLLPETRGLVDGAFLACMKPGAYLVNTARGELIDEQALVQAVRSGRLAGAALDVFSKEPPDPENPLLRLPQVIVTPHAASHTDGAMNAMGRAALRDCLAVLGGQQPSYPVT